MANIVTVRELPLPRVWDDTPPAESPPTKAYMNVPPDGTDRNLIKRRGASADLLLMSDLSVVRWRRFGKDRLYVNAEDGARVGWLDLLTGQSTIEDEARDAEFHAAIADHIRAEPELQSSASTPPETEPAEQPTSPHPAELDGAMGYARIDWRDIAANRPGDAAREQAVALRQAAPVRTLIDRARGVRTDERAWRIGADGEEKVAARLAKLPAEWTVLHAIRIGNRGSDIDHVAAGPGGVFTINAKHHPDAKVWVGGHTVMVNGHRQPYVRNARFEAERAATMLSDAAGFPVEVTGVVAIVGAHKGFVVKQQPDGPVKVVARKKLQPWLLQQPHTLDPERLATISKAARRSTTWQ